MLTAIEVMKFPPFGVIVGVATVEITAGAVTLRVKLVVLVTPPPVALTVMEKLPVGVDPVVVMLRTVEHVGLGLHEPGENEAEAPAGTPEKTLNNTA